MKRLATLYGGSLPEYRTINEPKYSSWLAEAVYLLDLPDTDLSRFDGLLVPEGSHHIKLDAASGQIWKFLEDSGTVILFGDQPISWLPGLDWEFRPAGESGELVAGHRDHGFYQYLTIEDATWHHHGVFHPPSGAETLLATQDGDAVLYIDRVSTPGTLLVTSLDPLAHFGGTFMPAAERFLDRFLPWVVEDLL